MTPHKLSRSGAAGPWASLLLTLLAVLMYLSPELAAWAAFDRTAIAAGELWRLITGHWTHWSGEHLVWDLLVFAVVGGALELRGRRNAFLTCTVLSALLISAGVWVLRPGMLEYRGLSGIDCALVTLVAVDLLRQAIQERRWGLSLALTGLLIGYLGKVTFEFTTGQTLFVDSGQGLFVPVPLAHVLGGAVGIALGLVHRSPRSPTADPLYGARHAGVRARAPLVEQPVTVPQSQSSGKRRWSGGFRSRARTKPICPLRTSDLSTQAMSSIS